MAGLCVKDRWLEEIDTAMNPSLFFVRPISYLPTHDWHNFERTSVIFAQIGSVGLGQAIMHRVVVSVVSWPYRRISPTNVDFEFRYQDYLPSTTFQHQPQQQQQLQQHHCNIQPQAFDFDFKHNHVLNIPPVEFSSQHNATYIVKQEQFDHQQFNNVTVPSTMLGFGSVPTNLLVPKEETSVMNYGGTQFNDFKGIQPPSPNFELYHDLIMQHLVKDIQVTCRRIGIPADPRIWTAENTQRWLTNVASQYHLAHVPFEKIGLSGAAICNMGLDALKKALPVGGELMHAQLNVWITANDYTQRYQAQYNDAMNNKPSSSAQSHDKTLAREKTKMRCAPVQIIPDNGQSTVIPPELLTPTNSDSGISTTTDVDDLSGSDPDTPSVKDDYRKCFFKTNIHLWQFLRELLDDPAKYGRCLRWIKRDEGVFKIEDSHQLAKLWGERKHRPAMNYDKLSRSLRQYYKKGILRKTSRSQRLVYQFLAPFC